MSWAGAANIDHGITIDLSALRGISVSQDRRITSVGGGTRWKDVYMKLDSMGLSVTGGRVAEVGVGGLITGGKEGVHLASGRCTDLRTGGNSFFGPRFGFACDNVENFQVQLSIQHESLLDACADVESGCSRFWSNRTREHTVSSRPVSSPQGRIK